MVVDQPIILELHALLVSAGLATRSSLDALGSSLSHEVRASLSTPSKPALELLSTLQELNAQGARADGTRPLETWLRTALILISGMPQEDRLRVILETRAPTRAVAIEARADGDLLAQLKSLLPAQFEEVVHRMSVEPANLSPPSAPQTTRAIELIRYASLRPDGERTLRDCVARVSAG